MRLVPLISLMLACATGPEASPEEWSPMPTHSGPPLGDLTLEASPLSPGLPFTLTSTAVPGDEVTFLASVTGDGGGPCPDILGGTCVEVERPLVLGSVTADDSGLAIFERTVPADLAAETVWFQATVIAGADSSVSPVIAAPIDVPGPFEPESVSITMELDLEFSGASAGLACLFAGVCDCTATYVGDGLLFERDGDRYTFEGTWLQSRSTCSDGVGLEGEVWAPADGLAYHSLTLEGGDLLTTWVAHASPEDFTVDPAADQWALEDLAELWDGGPLLFGGVTEEEELGVVATITSGVTMTFE